MTNAQPLASNGNGNGGPWSTNEVVRKHEDRIGELEQWRDEMRGALAMIKLILGTSIVGLAISLLSLVYTISGHH